MKEMRAFVAVNLSVSVLRRVNDVQRALRQRCLEDGWEVRWVPPPSLNIVLRYLGEIGWALPVSLEDALAPRLGRLPPFPLHARNLEILEGAEGPSKVVVGIEDPESGLASLQRALAGPLEEVGFKPEDEPRAIELVIGRVGTVGETPLLELASEAAEADFGECMIGELVVYRSDVKVPGAEFRDIFRVRLSGRRPAPRVDERPEPEPEPSEPDEEPREAEPSEQEA